MTARIRTTLIATVLAFAAALSVAPAADAAPGELHASERDGGAGLGSGGVHWW